MADVFQLPLPPQGLVFPETANAVAMVIVTTLTAAFIAYALWDWKKTRTPLLLLMVVGGAISYCNEPIMDILGLVWHPRDGMPVAFTTYGPVPIWGLFVYTILFGGMPAVLLRAAQRGISPSAYWKGVVIFMIFDLAVEWPALMTGLYAYYGDPSYSVMGLPLYWLFINPHGPHFTVALLLLTPQLFQGWRILLVPLLPMSTYASSALFVAWPAFSALNVPEAGAALKWAGGTLTFLLGGIVYYEMSKIICSRWVGQTGKQVIVRPAGISPSSGSVA